MYHVTGPLHLLWINLILEIPILLPPQKICLSDSTAIVAKSIVPGMGGVGLFLLYHLLTLYL